MCDLSKSTQSYELHTIFTCFTDKKMEFKMLNALPNVTQQVSGRAKVWAQVRHSPAQEHLLGTPFGPSVGT